MIEDPWVTAMTETMTEFLADTGLMPYSIEVDGTNVMLAVDPELVAGWRSGASPVDMDRAVLAIAYSDDALDAMYTLRALLGVDRRPAKA